MERYGSQLFLQHHSHCLVSYGTLPYCWYDICAAIRIDPDNSTAQRGLVSGIGN